MKPLYPKWFLKRFIHLATDNKIDLDFSLYGKAVREILEKNQKCPYCQQEVEARWISPNRPYIERAHFCRALDTAIRITIDMVTLKNRD